MDAGFERLYALVFLHERHESQGEREQECSRTALPCVLRKMGSIATSEAILVVEVQRLQCSSHLIVRLRLVVHINMPLHDRALRSLLSTDNPSVSSTVQIPDPVPLVRILNTVVAGPHDLSFPFPENP